jgi:hypothetical protein
VVGGTRIFLSYRREDTPAHAVRLRDGLIGPFGGGGVAMGMDDLPLIRDAVMRCDVLLVLIGQRWLTVRDASGRRCIDDLDDPLRLQVEIALRNRVTVVPVLTQDARMPSREELPESLAGLASRSPFRLSERHWHADVETLVDGLEQVCGRSAAPVAAAAAASAASRRQKRRRGRVAAGALVTAAAVVALVAAVVELWPT